MREMKNLLIASIKIFFRDKTAIWFSIFLPIVIMVIFGILDFNKMGTINLGIIDNAENTMSTQMIDTLGEIEILKLDKGDEQNEKNALDEGKRDLVLVLPEKFGEINPKEPTIQNINIFFNEGRQDRAQTGITIISDILEKYNKAITKSPEFFILESEAISSKNLNYIDFLIPGIVAMSIMQMGIIGVAASIVTFKEKGILRRLLATPIHPSKFLFSQIASRLIISLIQAGILISLGVIFFDLHIIGSYFALLFWIILGGIIFLCIGFAISGFAKTPNVAMALSNIIMMPMMFLSGVFFPRDALPDLVHKITNYLPLTYFADAIREIMNNGTGILELRTELLGLLVWVGISFILAVKLFRWE